MSGPILLVVLFAVGFVLWKYRVQVRDFFASTPGTVTPAATGTPATTPPVPPTGGAGDEQRWFTKYWWTIPLGIVGVVLLYYGVLFAISSSWESSSPGEVWASTKKYWTWIVYPSIALFFILFAFKGLWAKALQGFLVVVLAMFFVVIPLVHVVWGDDEKSGSQKQACLPISSTEVRRCMLSEKPLIFTTEQLAYAEALEFCIVRPMESSPYESKKIGLNTFEVRSTNGMYQIEYKAMKGPCPNKFS